MTTLFTFGGPVAAFSAINYPSTELGIHPVGPVSRGRQRLPSEPIGTFTLRLTNIVVGSRYRISRSGDNSLATPTASAEGVAGATTVDITLDLYAAGNANNDLAIDVRKGTSATKYLPFRTQATAQSGTVTAYISQVADTIA